VTDDVVELSRAAYRLADLAELVPSMWRYRELAHMAADLHKRDAGLRRGARHLRARAVDHDR